MHLVSVIEHLMAGGQFSLKDQDCGMPLSGCVKDSRVPAMGIALGMKEYKGKPKIATFVALHIDSL